MKKLLLAGLLSASAACLAGPIDELFGAGVLKVRWGASLEQVRGSHPGGQVSEPSGLLAQNDTRYVLRKGTSFLGVKRKSTDPIIFAFSSTNAFDKASIRFPLDRYPQLEASLRSKLGVGAVDSSSRHSPNGPIKTTSIQWRDEGSLVVDLIRREGPGVQVVTLVIENMDIK
jgi:hypothetical protein